MNFDTHNFTVRSKREGFRTALSGKMKNQNPYTVGTVSRQIWDKGFDEGLKLREFLWAD